MTNYPFEVFSGHISGSNWPPPDEKIVGCPYDDDKNVSAIRMYVQSSFKIASFSPLRGAK